MLLAALLTMLHQQKGIGEAIGRTSSTGGHQGAHGMVQLIRDAHGIRVTLGIDLNLALVALNPAALEKQRDWLRTSASMSSSASATVA